MTGGAEWYHSSSSSGKTHLQSRQVCKKTPKPHLLWFKAVQGTSEELTSVLFGLLCPCSQRWSITLRSLASSGRGRFLSLCLPAPLLHSKRRIPVKQQCICTATCKCNRRSSHPLEQMSVIQKTLELFYPSACPQKFWAVPLLRLFYSF